MPKEKGSSEQAMEGGLTVAVWCGQCLDVTMPAQRNGQKPKYSDEALAVFRVLVRDHIAPRIGNVRVADLDKKTVTQLIAKLPSDEVRSKVLNILTRVMEIAETKGKRRKGTNPCKGVVPRADPSTRPEHPLAGLERPSDWREERNNGE